MTSPHNSSEIRPAKVLSHLLDRPPIKTLRMSPEDELENQLGQARAVGQAQELADGKSIRSNAPHSGDEDKNLAAGSQFALVAANEPLLDGFILLRLAQFLNIDVYYIGLQRQQPKQRQCGPGAAAAAASLSESRQRLVVGDRKWPDDYEEDGLDKTGEFHTATTTTTELQLNAAASASAASPATNTSNGNMSGHAASAPPDTTMEQPPAAGEHRKNLLEEWAQICPIQSYIERTSFLAGLVRVMRIGLSLIAIMISVDKTISTILLCFISRPDIKLRPGNIGLAYETSDVSMSWLVLILLNISSMYILMSTVFNGHLLWQLLSQRLFLVSRTFQYKTMLSMFVFIYLEYIINISFTSNLFGWSFETNDNDVASADGSPGGSMWRKSAANGANGEPHGNIVNSYSVLSNIKKFVTEKDEANLFLDVLLTMFQFARGMIRIGPYITINYVTICLNEHIKTIRNQTLLTESLKRKQKLRMVVKSKRARMIGGGGEGELVGGRRFQQNSRAGNNISSSPINGPTSTTTTTTTTTVAQEGAARKKRVIFVTEASSGSLQTDGIGTSLRPPPATAAAAAAPPPPPPAGVAAPTGGSPAGSSLSLAPQQSRTPSPISDCASLESGYFNTSPAVAAVLAATTRSNRGQSAGSSGGGEHNQRHLRRGRGLYLDRIRDFNELEAYITNFYIFTGRLNRLMSRQGLALFFIVHNLVITTTLIVPEAISGGSPMAQLVRVLVVLIGIVPFIAGQALDGQLEQLSKQIDRIIIKQQFISRKRDNLVRIRELLHDIRVSCGGMLDFNIETGIKYLVVAFATAFFIEQEDYKLTRRH